MNSRVRHVETRPNYRLELTFTSGEVSVFDVNPYLDKGLFSELKNSSVFNSVRAFNGTVVWPNNLDFDPDTLYLESVKTSQIVL